ncbi:MAG: cysteine--tRNA ligase, partial [Candidatus Margulisbacteria bacterium]|nr:cysteine--tRNA ligase [Candidatus Margulisiibacteriota bacterium]
MLKIYNTLTRKKDEFIPIKKKKVKIYVCGVTVYDLCHIGHARAYVVFDVVRRAFEYLGYKVTYIQNFTDVDDKILNRAKEQGIDALELSKKMISEYFTDMDMLNIKRADNYPKVTEHIPQIIKFVEELEKKGIAYESQGDVYFDISKFKDYGDFSCRNLEDMQAGARVEVNASKRNPSDFVLWKGDDKSNLTWESPWSEGRPGWHIECSVMSREYLGDTFDIHGGGQDLVFPHHQNEIAQTEALTGKKMANYWMHNGFVRIDNEKMSKSLNNFFTVREVLKKYSAMDLRLFFLMTQYRMPINYSDQELEQAKTAGDRIRSVLMLQDLQETKVDLSEYKEEFVASLEDDFNTARALAVIFNLLKELNKSHSQEIYNLFVEFLTVLGLEKY